MSATTSIEWTDVSWNPVRGCSMVSAGCQNCYAMKQAHRFSGAGEPYEGLTEIGPQGARWNGQVRLVPEALEIPLRWQKPRRIFVNSMSDLFHEAVPDEFIERVLTTVAHSTRHTYQVLTKRPARMREFMQRWTDMNGQPQSNLHLGVSIEDQATADERIPILLQAPAAVRWISAEPLLGPVDLSPKASDGYRILSRFYGPQGFDGQGSQPEQKRRRGLIYPLNWVVVGGESGPGARPCDIGHIRHILQQCQAAGTPVFVKQLGAHAIIDLRYNRSIPGWTRRLRDRKGGDMAEWPEDLRVREWPR